MPARFQLDPAEFERLRAATEPMAGPIAKDAATERFSAAVAPLGVPTIDLLPVLRSAPHGQFFAGTVHLTAAGHATVAAALEAFIRREHLLDPRPPTRSGLQLNPLRRLLRGRLRGLPAAGPSRPEPVAARRQLLLLRGVGLALHRAAGGVDAGQLLGRGRPRPAGRAGLARGVAARPVGRARLPARRARLLQVRRLLRRLGGAGAVDHRLRRRRSGPRHRPAARHLVLHVHGDGLRRRRVPRRHGAGRQPGRLRALRRLLPAPRGRTDPAGAGVDAAVRGAAHDPARGSVDRRLADRHRPLQEDRRRRQPVADGRRRVRTGVSGRGRRRADRDLRLRAADLRRLRRLLRHGAGPLAAVRHRAQRQLPLPVRGDQPARVLAPLAHQPVDVAARLPVQAARRQPGRPLGDQPQPADHDGARRPVARGGVVVRAVGRLSGRAGWSRIAATRRGAACGRGRHAWRRSAPGSSPCT